MRVSDGWAQLQNVTAALAAVAAVWSLDVPQADAQQSRPAQRAATIVVLDGSNSMNARLPNDRAFKIVSVREALRASLPKIAGTEIGLAAFGARRASDCNDAEVIVPPTPDTSRVLGALERFQPRGFSPVVLALRNAAKALPQGIDKASLVLVLDDLASCRGEDPCAVAQGLKRDNPALAIHVVVLGPRPVDLPVLACMVKQTGGQLFQVTDGPGIAPAIEEALTVAGLDRRAPAVAAPSGPTADASRAAPAQRSAERGPGIDLSQPGLHLLARLTDGGPDLLLPITWRVRRAEAPRTTDTGETIQRRDVGLVLEETAPALSRILPNGRYEVEATAGLVTVRRTVEITAQGPLPVRFDLGAALLAISAPAAQGTEALADTTLTVLSVGQSGDGKEPGGTPLWIGRGGRHDLVVPPGSYRVRAAAGLASAERVLSVGPGVTGEVSIPLGAGRLVVEQRSADAASTQLLIETDDPDSAGGRREVYRTASRRLDLVLPAGSYLLTARRDGVDARERVQLKPGETTSRQLGIAATRLRLAGRMGNASIAGLPVSYRVERLDSPGRPLQSWSDTEPTFELSPGRYRVEARLGAQNAVAVRELEIRPGAGDHRVELDTGAGRIQLKLAGGAAGLGFGEVYWQIVSDRGEVVWRTIQPEPMMALAAGRYTARAESRDRVVERAFDVRTGDSRVVEVGG